MKTQSERNSMQVAAQAAEWFVEHRSGPLSILRRRAFARWLRASPLHVAEYLAIARAAQDVAAEASRIDTPLDALLAEAAREETVIALPTQANAKLRSSPISVSSGPRGRAWRPAARAGAATAAAITACLALVVGAWLWRQNRPVQEVGTQYQTQAGQDRTVRLADDTILYLTADSAVRVRFDAHRRLVDIERGQALFEVAHDPARPFEVRARNSVIRDVGTIFDVDQDSRRTVVTVLQGRVAVWTVSDHSSAPSGRSVPPDRNAAPIHRHPIDLNAGEQARILSTGAVRTSRPRNLQKAAPWLQPQIAFNHKSLAAIAAEFNRHNRIQIELTDPRIAAIAVSGVFHSYDVASFASFLNNLSGVRARMVNGQLQVSATAQSHSQTSP